MALPPNLSTVHIFGQYLSTDGIKMSGTVSFTPAPPVLLDPGSGTIIAPTPITVTLDSSGSIDATLPCTDDLDMNPSMWTYSVSENLTDHNGAHYANSYSISVPTGADLNITSLIPVVSYTGEAIYRGPAGAAGTDVPPPGTPDGYIATSISESVEYLPPGTESGDWG